MSRTQKLKDAVKEALKTAAPIPFYYRFALPTVKPPYGIFSLKLIQRDECVDQYELLVDLCDYSARDERIEDYADAVESYMDYLNWIDIDQGWHCYCTGRDNIDETDKSIQRRRLTFELRYTRRIC